MKLIINKFKRHESTYPVVREEAHGIKFIENVKSEFEIPFSIFGGNGQGKSTILEAVSFCLTGKDLQGNEFKQVYDNRVDLHEAIADVIFIDNYGNEFRRVVKPTYSVNRAGIEELKIKRSTQCSKNGIDCNDFADEFSDFLKFGTDYFFNQKAKSSVELETMQRNMFIDVLKSKMPDYDVKTASLRKKELEKAQRTSKASVESKMDKLKDTKDVEVSVIDSEILALNAEFVKLSEVDNSKQVAEINKKNNDASMAHFAAKTNIQNDISRCNISIERTKADIEKVTKELKDVENAVFVPKEVESTEPLEKQVVEFKNKLTNTEYFETIEAYAAKFFNKNPVLVENQKKIIEIGKKQFTFSGEESGCPLTKQKCEVAEKQAEKTELWVFNSENEMEITSLKAQNRSILTKEMTESNQKYLSAKSDLQEAARKLNNLIEANKQVEKDNEFAIKKHNENRALLLKAASDDLSQLEVKLQNLESELLILKSKLTDLVEPKIEKLPESLEIDPTLINAHAQFTELNTEITKQIGVNEHNIKLRSQYNAEIKSLQDDLFVIGGEIVKLTAEISDYFSNLNGIVKSEFAGDIEIDVQLLEYVMSKDEWSDCFKITANGNVFPYETNGALKTNLKLQVLATFQRLKDYKGVTIVDNCEGNTTQPINTCGLNCVLATATFDETLIIK